MCRYIKFKKDSKYVKIYFVSQKIENTEFNLNFKSTAYESQQNLS